MLYSNDNYKCPVCYKYIVCTSSGIGNCVIDPTRKINRVRCKSCVHNYITNKDKCLCSRETLLTYIKILHNDLLESNSNQADYYF